MQFERLVLFFVAAQAVAGQPKKQPGVFRKLEDVAQHTFEDLTTETKQCSCSCCLVSERLQQDVAQLSAEKSDLLTHQCVHLRPSSSECPLECAARDRSHNLEKEEFVKPGAPIDYARYCHSSCAPTVARAGASCAALADGASALGGSGLNGAQGDEPPSGWSPADAYKYKNKNTPEQEAEEREQLRAKAEAEAEEAEEKRLTWDMRKVLAGRVRAEAGAATSRSTLSAEMVKLHSHAIERSAKMLKKIKKAVQKEAKDFGPDLLLSKMNATNAGEAAKETFTTLKKAKAAMKGLRTRTRHAAEKIIKERTVKAAAAEAKSYTERLNLDKPDVYRRQVVGKAAQPYMKAVSTASERSIQYQRASESAAQHARNLRAQVAGEETAAQLLTEQGDKISAAMKSRTADALRLQAGDDEALSKQYAKTAKSAEKTAKAWQNAAFDVTKKVSYLYDQSVATTQPPPPLVAMPPPASLYR